MSRFGNLISTDGFMSLDKLEKYKTARHPLAKLLIFINFFKN